MKRRTFLTIGSAAAASKLLAHQQPNILLITADDLGYGDLPKYGSTLRTPSIDALCETGVRFTHYYNASPQDDASCQAMLTGKYAARDDWSETIPSMLAQSGYRTAFVGNWRLQRSPKDVGYSDAAVFASNPRLSALITQQAASYASNAPFMLHVAYSAPHTLGDLIYPEAIGMLDENIGALVGAMPENTCIVFCSDNGPSYQGSTGGLRGRGDTFEGGMRSPCIMKHQGLPANTVCDTLTSAMDLLPTFASLAGARSGSCDGIDILPALRGEVVEREPFLYFDGEHLQCIRKGPWKLHVARYNIPARNPLPPEGRVNLPLAPELYNVVRNPESYDCSEDKKETAEELFSCAAEMVRRFPPNVELAWQQTRARKVWGIPVGAWPVEEK